MVLVASALHWLFRIAETALSFLAITEEAAVPPPSWHQYIRSPSSRTVSPVAVLGDFTTGSVTNPSGLLGTRNGYTTLTRAAPPIPPSWPSGTTVTASSYHGANWVNGRVRNYNPENAVDGDVSTFWNDDTKAAYPDVLIVLAPNSMELSGITILSCKDGVPMDFTVDVLIGTSSWLRAGEVANNEATLIRVPFSQPFTSRGVRITVTQDQASSGGEYTRINEVWPALVDDFPPAPSVVVDFGQVVVGYLSISFAGASNNNPGLRLAFSETTEFLGDVSDYTRSYNGDAITPGTDQVAVPDHPSSWTDAHGCIRGKVCSDGLHGFRYVRISLDALSTDYPDAQPYGSVFIDGVSLKFSAYLGTPDTFKGWFESSDKTLNQYWYDAAYTNDLCIDTFRADDTEPRDAASQGLIGKLVIHDGPKRDRDPYVGDLAVSARTLYYTHDFSIAAENVLADLGNHQRADGWIPPASINGYTLPLFDYPLWWVVTSYDLIMFAGRHEYAKKYYPSIVKVLDTFYPSATDFQTNLLSKGLGETAGYGDYAFLPRSGIVTYYNALYVLALNNAATIARFYNYTSDAERWSKRARVVSDSVNQYLWDDYAGAYVDTYNSTTHAQDGNALAILAGIANNSQATAALSYWSTLGLPYGNPFYDANSIYDGFSERVYAFISYFEIAARFENNMGDSAIEEIKRLYGWMSSQDPGITFWEGIGGGGSKYEGPYTSLSHGWSTGVLPALSMYILGVAPTAPGFSNWTLKPTIVDGVTWARGVVPTPNGAIGVNWTTETDSVNFEMAFEVPMGTQAAVSIPVSRASTLVFLDDALVWNGKMVSMNSRYADGCVTFEASGGRHWVRAPRTAREDL